MSHTKEIWKLEESGMYILACDPDGNHGYVAVEIRGWGRLSKLGDDEAVKIQKDRARRIAALWNAAEELGLTTEKIAEGEIQAIFFRNQERSKLIGVALERIEKLEAEKAESEHALGFAVDAVERLEAEKAVMLEALEALVDMLDSGDYRQVVLNLADAAIRKARGEE